MALEHGINAKDTQRLIAAFLSEVLSALIRKETVYLEGLGRLHMTESNLRHKKMATLLEKPLKGQPAKTHKERYLVSREFKVFFKKSEVFNRLLHSVYGPSGHREKKV